MSTPLPASLNRQAERARALARRLAVALALSIPVMVVSMVPSFQFPGWQWAAFALSAIVATWCAWPFHAQAFAAARHGSTTMNTLVSLGIIASMAWSIYALLWGGAGQIGMHMEMGLTHHATAHVYFESATMITTFLLLGRWLEARARYRAGDAIRALMALEVNEAIVVREGEDGSRREVRAAASELVPGDLVRVRPGAKIPVDGIVREGTSAVDQSVVTGESMPVDVSPGSRVIGASLNTSGSLVVEVTAVGADTVLSQIARMVADAQAGKAPVQKLADRVSAVFVPIVIALALATGAAWLLAGHTLEHSLTAAVAVLVVACPCALGLATPTALLVGSGRAAREGVIFHGPEVLEGAHAVDTVVLDKTGTLTSGVMSVQSAVLASGTQINAPFEAEAPEVRRLVALAGAAEAPSEHPLAQALTRAGAPLGDISARATRFGSHAGMGVHALVGNDLVLVGRARWMRELGLDVPQPVADAVGRGEADGATVVVVARAVEEPHTEPLPTPAEASARAVNTLDLAITGMSCAACVGRVERAIKKVDGVDASVNLATESARVTLPDGVDATPALTDRLVAAVTAAGYGAAPAAAAPRTQHTTRDDTLAPLASGEVLGALIVRDSLRETSAAALADLTNLGLTTWLATGDNEGAARHVAHALGLTRVRSGLLPSDKRDLVAQLQSNGACVAMVGDGINDAAALAQASTTGLGIALSSGTDSAIAAGNITLMNADIRGVVAAVRIARRTLRIIKENLAWAFGYNVIAIPLAACGLLSPLVASAFMASSSVIVVTNSLRLRGQVR